MNETYALLQRLTGYAGPVQYVPERTGDIRHSLAHVGAARDAIGYDPKVELEEGLRRTVEWYQNQGAIEMATPIRTAVECG